MHKWLVFFTYVFAIKTIKNQVLLATNLYTNSPTENNLRFFKQAEHIDPSSPVQTYWTILQIHILSPLTIIPKVNLFTLRTASESFHLFISAHFDSLNKTITIQFEEIKTQYHTSEPVDFYALSIPNQIGCKLSQVSNNDICEFLFGVELTSTSAKVLISHSFPNDSSKDFSTKSNLKIFLLEAPFDGYLILNFPFMTNTFINFHKVYYFPSELTIATLQRYSKRIAELLYALYFFLEPHQSIFFPNRSKYNFKPAMNGRITTYGYYLESHFNINLQRMIFYSSKINKNRVYLDPDILNNSDDREISMFIRMNIFSNSFTNPDYSSGFGSYLNDLISIKFSDSSIFYFSHQIAPQPVVIDNYFVSRFSLRYEAFTVPFLDCTHSVLNSDYFDGGFEYFFLKIDKYYLGNQIKFEISSNHSCFVNPFELIIPVSWMDATVFMLGTLDSFILFENPFMYVFYDLQIFSNSEFLTLGNEFKAFHGNRPQSVYCQNNEFLLRRSSNHPDIDNYFNSQNLDQLPCDQRVLNINCVANCILCADTKCLLCDQHFLLDSGTNSCINKLPQILSGDFLIRFKKDISSSPQLFGQPNLVVVIMEVDHARIAGDSTINSQTLGFFYNGFFICRYFSLPDYSPNPSVQSLLSSTPTQYVQLTLPEANLKAPGGYFTIVPDVSLSITKTIFTPDCSASQDFTSLYGSFPFLACPSLQITFDGTTYMSDHNSSLSNPTYSDIVEPNDFSISLPCNNGCNCTKNECLSGSASCPSDSYFVENKLFSSGSIGFGECMQCPSECLFCEDGICTDCTHSQSGDFFISDLSYNESGLKTCDSCDLFNLLCATSTQPDASMISSDAGFFYAMFSFDFKVFEFRKCMDKCAQCSGAASCDVCSAHYFFHPDKEECVSKKKYCSNYDSIGEWCIECKIGFLKDFYDICVKCPSHCENCIFNLWNQIECTKCQSNYTLENDRCIKHPFHINQYTFDIEISPSNNIECSFTICSKCKNVNVCSECPSFYYLFKDKKRAFQECRSCPINSNACFAGVDNLPIISECAGSTPIYNKKLNRCFPIVANCLLYDFTKFRCKRCIDDYFLKTSNSKQTCEKCDANCSFCDPFTGCVICKSGMFLQNSKCIACPNNCLQCLNESTCLRCHAKYVLISKICVKHCNTPQSSAFDSNFPQQYIDSQGICRFCSDCKICESYGIKICPLCSQCTFKCELTWTRNKDKSYHLSFDPIAVYLDITSLRVIYIKSQISRIEEGKIRLKTEVNETFLVKRWMFETYNCSPNDFYELKSIVMFDEKESTLDTLVSAVSRNKDYFRGTATIFSAFQLNSSTFINLININQLFDYLFYADIQISGFSGYFHKNSVKKNIEIFSSTMFLSFLLTPKNKYLLSYSTFVWKEYQSMIIKIFYIKGIILVILFILMKMFKRIRKNTKSLFLKIEKYDQIKIPKTKQNLLIILDRKSQKNKHYKDIIWWMNHRIRLFLIKNIVNRMHKNRYFIYDSLIQMYIADFAHGFGKLLKASILFPFEFFIPTMIQSLLIVNIILFILFRFYNRYVYLNKFKKLRMKYKLELIMIRNSIINTVYIFFFVLLTLLFINYSGSLPLILLLWQVFYIVVKTLSFIKIENNTWVYLSSDITFFLLLIYCRLLQIKKDIEQNYLFFDFFFIAVNVTKVFEICYIVIRNSSA